MNDSDDRPNGRIASAPPKRVETDQVNLELDPREQDASLDADLAALDIDAARLFSQAIGQTRMALCITDPTLADAPIVYANEAFVRLTGYPRDEIIGRNCRFLQGENTDRDAIHQMRRAIDGERVVVVDVLNYRKDGTPFWNAVHIGPIYDGDGRLRYFYGSQWDVTEVFNQREEALRQLQIAEEMQHRVGNLFGVLSAIVRISARGETDVKQVVGKIEDRIGALARAQRLSIGDTGGLGENDLRRFIEQVIAPYRTDRENRIVLDGPSITVPRAALTPLGLTLHEVATNAIKYGALKFAKGKVSVEWRIDGNELVIEWVERDGPKVDHDGLSDPKGSGTGTRIVSGMLRSIGGSITPDFAPEGLTMTVRLPLDLDK